MIGTEDDGEPMTRAEWTRFGEKVRSQCRAASMVGTAIVWMLCVDALWGPPLAWHWWALLSAYVLAHAAYRWSDERFWKMARLQARRMRRFVAREFPEALEDFDQRFPDAIPTRPPEPSEPPP